MDRTTHPSCLPAEESLPALFNLQKRSWEDMLPVSHCKRQTAG